MTDRTEIGPAQFRDWLASKPRDETFWFYHYVDCALAQYAKHLHPEAKMTGGGDVEFNADDHRYAIVPGEPVRQAWDALSKKHDSNFEARWTFGEAVDELDKQLAAAV